MSLYDEKGCFATRRVTSSREALFKTFEKCDFVTISVALRREGLLRNEKCDFVTRSVVTSLDPSVGYADSSRGLFKPLFSAYSLPLFAASLRRTSQMFFVFPRHVNSRASRRLCLHFPRFFKPHFSSALPTLLYFLLK